MEDLEPRLGLLSATAAMRAKGSPRSPRRLLGQWAPQLIARRRPPSDEALAVPGAAMNLAGCGEDEIITWASAGFGAPKDAVAVEPLQENRSHNSRAGSAWGDLRASDNCFTLTVGGVDLELFAGDEMGEELRARFLPRRW